MAHPSAQRGGSSSESSELHDGLVSADVSRRMKQEDSNDVTFLKEYSFKFLGCNEIMQFDVNASASNGTTRLIHTFPLARFRLCPLGSCSDSSTKGCNSKYGDYMTDISTAVQIYLDSGGFSYGQSGLSPLDYLQCTEYNATISGDDDADYTDDDLADDASYNMYYNDTNSTSNRTTFYLGPYCSGQGGDIMLGVFSDSGCQTHLNGGADLFNQTYGIFPTEGALLSKDCISCEDSYDMCTDLYQSAGKCEKKLDISFPNDSACNYMTGLSRLLSGGVVPAKTYIRRSKGATIAIEVLAFSALLLGFYVYCLKSKLEKARKNLLLS